MDNRKKYVDLYYKLILDGKSGAGAEDNDEIVAMENSLSWEVALLFRKLAHQRVSAEKERTKATPKGIVGWFFGGSNKKASESSEAKQSSSGEITQSEIDELNKIVDYDPQLEERLDKMVTLFNAKEREEKIQCFFFCSLKLPALR